MSDCRIYQRRTAGQQAEKARKSTDHRVRRCWYGTGREEKYLIKTLLVDLISFCSKNPKPMLKYLDLLRPYGMYWYVTITGYGRDIEPNVPDIPEVIETFKRLSEFP